MIDQRPKILHINFSDKQGGAALSAWKLFAYQRSLGFDVKYLVKQKTCNDPDVIEIPSNGDLISKAHHCFWKKLDSIPGIRNSGVIYKWRGGVNSGGLPAISRALGMEYYCFPDIAKILQGASFSPDVIHMHNLHPDYFDLRTIVRLSDQYTVIISVRDSWLFTGHCAYPIDCTRWQLGCGKCPDLLRYPAIGMDLTRLNWLRKKAVFQKSKVFIIAPTTYMKDNVTKSFIRPQKMCVIPNAVDTDVFFPADKGTARQHLGLPLDRKIVLFTGQSRYKDIASVEQAALLMKYKKPILFICLGTKKPDWVLPNGEIRYLGWVDGQKEMATYFRASDVFVHSAFDEAFGKTIIEAMACGTPVIATSSGAVPELISDSVNGFLVSVGDSTKMAEEIEQLLTDPLLAEQFSVKGIEGLSQKYSIDIVAQRFIDWYGECLSYGK